MTNSTLTPPPDGEFVLFQSADGNIRLECRFASDSLWLSQAAMAELYQVTPQAITQHIKAVYDEGELEQSSTCKDYLHVQTEGIRQIQRKIRHYNLGVILAVGYRVRSTRGTQFRQWATQTLQEYLVKGFLMDDERLKNPPVGKSVVPDYFDEMLERIRDIRSSERRVYLRVLDIFTMAADYRPSDKETTQFFRVIQNKLHYASTGMTAAELIAKRVDAGQPNMGLTSFKYDEVRRTDVTIVKNYLNTNEIDELNRIVSMWLDFAEDQAKRRKQVFLLDWQTKLDQFLEFNDREVLQNSGSVSKKEADEKAKLVFDDYAQRRRYLKEAEGERMNIDVLRAIASKEKK
ncbi:RhuM family protein [Scandinavium sp. V105_16]|uniref:RhuM family protein n=1 Tax=Scandinavium lactucae TaxID=3095028 RepID=A0AAJ2VVI8_9ENTR|nr:MULTISPECIES: RhuM family protein [unclassified Scandinavium]MDX6021382.1 RhuM family protein [Scandinavium sp. V105_16]MDX6033118.1 RhuM family protein [Scandinavium sp. V105_12]